MKRVLVMVVAMVVLMGFTGCAGVKPKGSIIDEKRSFYMLDFTQYSERGFLFTPKTYDKEYESIGEVSYSFLPASIYKKSKFPTRIKDVSYEKEVWVDDDINVKAILDTVYVRCLNKGANAIIDLRFDDIREVHSEFSNPNVITGVKITGFAIRRK